MSDRQVTSNDNRNLIKQIKTDQDDKENRLNDLSTVEYDRIRFVHLKQFIINGVGINNVTPYTSIDLRALFGAKAKALIGTFWTDGVAGASTDLRFGTLEDPPDTYSQHYRWSTTVAGDPRHLSQFVMIQLGSDGKFLIKNLDGTMTICYLVVFGVLE